MSQREDKEPNVSLSPSRPLAMFVGIVLLVSGIAAADTLITTSGGKFDGTVIEDKDGYVLTTPNGSKMTFPKSMVAEVQRSQSQPAGKGGGAGKPAAEEKLLKVVATGAGEDPDKAIQAAFNQAIEQAVGVLVDAETIVKNDQIVTDKVLTFSRGFIKSFEVVKQWKQDNLHYARIAAVVETTKLAEKLRASNIAIREVPGELMARQIQFDVKNEDEAAMIFKKIMDDFDMVKFTKVNIVGKTKVEREGANAEMTVKFNLSPDYAAWEKFAVNLRQFLPKVATKRARVAMERTSVVNPKGETVKEQLTGKGTLMGLVANAATAGKQIQWDVYLVPQTLETVFKSAPGGGNYAVAVVLLDKDDREILRRNVALNTTTLQRLKMRYAASRWNHRGMGPGRPSPWMPRRF